MNNVIRTFVLLFASLGLGCAPIEVPRTPLDGSAVGGDEAIIYLRAHLRFDPSSASAPAALGTSIVTLEKYPAKAYPIPLIAGDNAVVFRVNPGRYGMLGIALSNKAFEGHYANYAQQAEFAIEPGRINYLGDVTIVVNWAAKTYTMAHSGNAGAAKPAFVRAFPKYAESLPFANAISRLGSVK